MTTDRRHPRLGRLVAVVALLAGTAAALVGGGTAAGAASSNKLTVTAGEYTYKLSGTPKPGWLEMEFDNAGVEDHMMVVFPVKPKTTDKQLKAAVMSDGLEQLFAGEPLSGVPALVGPGQATTTIAEVKAGRYAVLCFIATADGSPHVAHGMYKLLDVKGSKSSFKPPTDGVADVTLTDTAIEVPEGDAPKSLTVKVTNEGTAPHSFQLVKLETGKTIDDAQSYFDPFFDTGTAVGAAPGVLVGGVSTINPGGMAYVEWQLESGHYGYLSTDGNDPPDDDYTKGLKGEFDVS